MTEALERKPVDSAGPGDIIALAGIPEITIGETLADPDNPIPLPLITVDEPAISMTIGTNTSPLVGRTKGTKVTARPVSYTHLRAHETVLDLVCRLLLEKKKP